MNPKKAIVVHSGGMDSSICLALAMREFSSEAVLSLSFSYGQRHANELRQAEKICLTWGVDHAVIEVDSLHKLTRSALMNKDEKIRHVKNTPANTIVIGRNGLMARLAAIHANSLGASCIYMGVMGLEGCNSGYRDCNRAYMDLKQEILRLDLDDPSFEIRTPLVHMTKLQTMELANNLGLLDFLIRETITCYEGLSHPGCQQCPACRLRNDGIRAFFQDRQDIQD